MIIFNMVLLWLVVKHIIIWIEKRYQLGDRKKLFKSTFNIFLTYSLLEVGIVIWGLSATDFYKQPDYAGTRLLIYSGLESAAQLLVLYISLNRYLKIKYFKSI